MKAIEIDAFGSPEVLHAVDVPEPHAANGQVRVRVKAVGVNPYEAKVRSGAMQQVFKVRLPAILGSEISGVVDEVTDSLGFKKGDEVFGWSDSGAYAELALATRVIPKPKDISWELAAALPIAGETALRVLELLQLKAGETLLVHGGAGVVGNMGVQLALLRGATVIATAAERNHAALKALGAIPVIYGDGLVARVRALGKKIDAVFDAAGKGAIPDSIELRGGTSRIVTIADPAASKLGVTFSAGQVSPSAVAALKTIADLASQKKVTVQIAETLPLAQAAKAHVDLEKKEKAGKVLLKP